MTGLKLLDDEEVRLTNRKLVAIVLDEFENISNRRISNKTINDIFKTLWTTIASELLLGNRVSTPIGTFIPYIDKKFGRTNWEALGVRRSLRPVKLRRMNIKFKPSPVLLQSIEHLIGRYDAHQARTSSKVPYKRRVVRTTRSRKRPSDETMGS